LRLIENVNRQKNPDSKKNWTLIAIKTQFSKFIGGPKYRLELIATTVYARIKKQATSIYPLLLQKQIILIITMNIW